MKKKYIRLDKEKFLKEINKAVNWSDVEVSNLLDQATLEEDRGEEKECDHCFNVITRIGDNPATRYCKHCDYKEDVEPTPEPGKLPDTGKVGLDKVKITSVDDPEPEEHKEFYPSLCIDCGSAYGHRDDCKPKSKVPLPEKLLIMTKDGEPYFKSTFMEFGNKFNQLLEYLKEKEDE